MTTYGGAEYATIYKYDYVWVNVRLKKNYLHDIGLYIKGPKAKQKFDEFLSLKNSYEKDMGYKLVWDRNEKRNDTRISRFGPIFENESLSKNPKASTYDFDIYDKDSYEKIAKELIKFYKVFILKYSN